MASILNNVAALGATRQIGITNTGLKHTIERLTTGKRINRASDDASGLATANGLAADVRIAAENRRIQNDSVTTLQTQDGYLEEVSALLLRATELAAGGSGTAELNLISTTVGTIITASGASGITALAGVTTANISSTLASVSSVRGTIGANMMIAQSNANLQGILQENKTAQMSQIMDADIGAEVVNLSKWQILNQSGISALSQANQAGQSVLALLR